MRKVLFSKWLRVILGVLALGFLVWAVVSRWSDIESKFYLLSFGALAASFGFSLIGQLFQMLSWRALLADLGGRVTVSQGCSIYYVGQIGKYIPGSVWPMLFQMELATDYGVARRKSVAGQYLMYVMQVCVAALVAAIFFPMSGSHTAWAWMAYILAPICLVLAFPPVLSRTLGFALTKARRAPLDDSPTWRGFGLGMADGIISQLGYGTMTFLITAQFTDASIKLWAICVAAYALSWLVGFVIVFLPAGAGARDAVLFAVMTVVVDHETALTIALFTRLIMVICDVLAAGVGFSFVGPKMLGSLRRSSTTTP